MKDIDFNIILDNFNEGNSPLAHIDNKTFTGNKAQASDMRADVISKPGFLIQSPALVNLANNGVVSELIRFILDRPTAPDTTFAIGTSKLFKLSDTTVASGGAPIWPQTIPTMTEGESVVALRGNLYALYNRDVGGDIAKMPLSSSVIDHDWGTTLSIQLEKAKHPVAVKEDIMIFGNGRYVGVYFDNEGVLNVRKLDFGEGAEVVDIVFNSNVWWIAVNTGVGGRTQGQVYMYDGSALSNNLLDEAGVGVQEIGFLYVLNGIVYICYQDLSSGFYAIGFFAGRQIKPLRYFTGTLPDHRQKTLFKNTIIFCSAESVWSCGAVIEQLPIQISQLLDGGYANLGGIAAPFGVPMIASSDGTSNHRLAALSGYTLDSYYKSIFVDVTNGTAKGKPIVVIVTTKPLAEDAKAIVVLEANQATLEYDLARNRNQVSLPLVVQGENKTRHVFRTIGLESVEDVRVLVTYTGTVDGQVVSGSIVNDCPIRKIEILGNYDER